MATYTPWVGFFNPDETDSPQRGVYVVYLFTQDMERLALSLNQGMEYLRKDLGDKAARESLAADANITRDALDSAWCYLTPEAEETRATLKAFRAFDPGTVWCAWEE
jgi:hypothetical protein